MKYLYIIAIILFIGFVGLVGYLLYMFSREQNELRQDIPYWERQTELLQELIDEPVGETREEMIKKADKGKG